jgi:salicylate hydroxylase
MLQDEQLASLIKSPAATCWIGHKGHVMAYPIRQGTLYNFVMCYPDSVAVGKENEPASLDELKKIYQEWGPDTYENYRKSSSVFEMAEC